MSPSPSVIAAGQASAALPPVTSGLLMYYPAAYQKTVYADAAPITTLYDRSGNNNHATPTAGSVALMRHTGGAGGTAPFLDCVNHGYRFILPDAPYAGITAVEYFASFRPKLNNRGPWNHNGSDGDQYYPFDNGNCYSNFHRSDRPSFANPLSPMNVWQRIGVWSTSAGGADSWCWRTNEVERLKTSSTFQAGSAGGRWIGSIVNAGNPNGTEWGCVLIYNRRLTPAERADVDAWLIANPAGGL